MPNFVRSFDTRALSEWTAKHPDNVVVALFDRWALPGEPATDSRPLRLAVREGYVNFYAKGQSVAKLSMAADGPRLSLHNAYVDLRRDGQPADQRYRTFGPEALADRATTARVSTWIDAALSYASAEKRFVDDLVTVNPGVLELEMALPASDLPGGARVAPRMDLIVAQPADRGSPRIAFWEAKCANNPELRSSKERELLANGTFSGPLVLGQIHKYVAWMSESGRVEQVQAAYQKTAGILLKLLEAFRRPAVDESNCALIWRSLAYAENMEIVAQPGIVIGNYWPRGSKGAAVSARMAQCAASFARNGHRAKLERNHVVVHEVGPEHGSAILPPLLSA
jgi:hypothetical protein